MLDDPDAWEFGACESADEDDVAFAAPPSPLPGAPPAPSLTPSLSETPPAPCLTPSPSERNPTHQLPQLQRVALEGQARRRDERVGGGPAGDVRV